MKLLNQRKNQLGYVYKNYINNDISTVNEFNKPTNT